MCTILFYFKVISVVISVISLVIPVISVISDNCRTQIKVPPTANPEKATMRLLNDGTPRFSIPA